MEFGVQVNMTEEFEEFDDLYYDELISKFIETGIIKIHGFDSITEEFTYILTPKAKELYPELFNEHFSFVNQMAFTLWEKGYIEMKFDDNGPLVMLKELDYEIDVFPHLSTEERFFIENMIYLESSKGDII